jgi:hypothetical protein
MQKGDLVRIRGITEDAVRNVIPDYPHALGVVTQPGTLAVFIRPGSVMSQVLLGDRMLWFYNYHMEVVNESR